MLKNVMLRSRLLFIRYLHIRSLPPHYGHVRSGTLASCVSAIGEQRLSGEPLALIAQESNDRCNIVDVCETTIHCHRLVECDSIVAFLRIEEG